jgi:hypothetical protein
MPVPTRHLSLHGPVLLSVGPVGPTGPPRRPTGAPARRPPSAAPAAHRAGRGVAGPVAGSEVTARGRRVGLRYRASLRLQLQRAGGMRRGREPGGGRPALVRPAIRLPGEGGGGPEPGAREPGADKVEPGPKRGPSKVTSMVRRYETSAGAHSGCSDTMDTACSVWAQWAGRRQGPALGAVPGK